RRLVHRVPDREEAVVAQDHRLLLAEGVGETLALLEVEDDARVVVEQGVVLVEGADVLRDRVEQPAERGPRLPVDRGRVGRRMTSGRAACTCEWMTNAAVLTPYSPSMTSPLSLTRMRSETRMWLKFMPNGFTQKWSSRSGSRAVMWPAMPSSNPNFPNR